MYWFLLKKALPFTLAFVFGAALSGLVGLFGSPEKKGDSWPGTRTYEFGSRCRVRRHHLVAESKPLNILYQPSADLSRVSPAAGDVEHVTVNVTFGANGKVQKVEPAGGGLVRQEVWEAVEGAARQIQFEPETVNGLPVTITREVDIQPFRCGNTVLTQR